MMYSKFKHFSKLVNEVDIDGSLTPILFLLSQDCTQMKNYGQIRYSDAVE